MDGLKNFMKKRWIYFVAFALPWVIGIIHALTGNGWLWGGEGSILKGDMSLQLVPFHYGLWDKLHLGESLDYTWNVGGGLDYHAILGYALSPFSLLAMLLPRDSIPYVVQLIMILKWSFVNVSMVFFFYHTKYNTLKEHKQIVSLYLGLIIGLSNGMINFVGYIQFNDVIICFPILLLLVEKMVDEKKWKLYYILMAFCMFSNLYLTFGICIFLLFWFILQLDCEVQEKGKKFLLFVGSSVLAALTNLSTILNQFILADNRLGTENSISKKEYIAGMLIKPQDFIKQLFIMEPIAPTASMDPNIYFSIIGVMLAVLFLFVKGRKKIYMLIMSGILTASFFFGALNIVWHCFNVPNAVYHRFVYLFIFMMAFLNLYVIVHMEEIKLWHIIFMGVFLVVAFVYTFLQLKVFEHFTIYLATILLLALYLMLFILYVRKSITYVNMLLVISIFGILELSVNAWHAFTNSFNYIAYWDEGGGIPMMELSDQITDLKDGERVGYTVEGENVGLVTSKPTTGVFVSNINGNTRLFYESLGMATAGSVEYHTLGASPLINLMMNIRYGVGAHNMEYSDAEVISENNSYQLYRMKRLAGLGYMVETSIKDWNIGDLDSCFEEQNQFVKLSTGKDDIFNVVKPTIICRNIWGEEIENSEYSKERGGYLYDYEYQFGNDNDMLLEDFTVEEDMDLYTCIHLGSGAYVGVLIDDEPKYKDYTPSSVETIHIGNVKKGQKVTIYEIPMNPVPGQEMILLLQFAKFDEKNYEKAYESLSKNVYNVNEMESNYVSGTIYAEEDGIMMTSIQAEDGFSVYVDGQEITYDIIGNAMIGVPLKAGNHTVEFQYKASRSKTGKIVSLCAFVCFILISLIERKKYNNSETSVG